MDSLSKIDRSINMSRIRSKDTKPELYLRRLLFSKGYRYRVNYKKIFGSPDFYFIRKETAIFLHGCFWHRHKDCKYAYTPKSNVAFWQSKFDKNVIRDFEVICHLREQQIRCLIIWECTIRRMKKDLEYQNDIMAQIEAFLNSTSLFYLEL
ncbi:MAG: very short patch repair endonuclease [Saccharofermentanales bacterium]